MGESICAVVVTYNRKELLRECLYALKSQQRPVDCILVVDNASTDGTDAMLASEFTDVTVLPLPENIGGAGGFHEGMKQATAHGYEWVWVMDDDTIARPDALKELLVAYEACKKDTRPMILAGRVLWTDGSLHPMNIQKIKKVSAEQLIDVAAQGMLPIRSASFVSALVNRQAVEKYGLPIADYFIWNDDVEFTARVLRSELGILVLRSEAIHKTPRKYVARLDTTSGRYYYSIRNRLWMAIHSSAWSARERSRILLWVPVDMFYYLWKARFSRKAMRLMGSAMIHGLFKRPRS